MLWDGSRIPCGRSLDHWQILENEFKGFDRKVKIFVGGTGVFTPNGKLKELEEITMFTVIEPPDVGAALDEIKQLPDGWLDGEGRVFNAVQLNQLESLFLRYYPTDLPQPYVVPLPEGNIQFDWHFTDWITTCEVNLEDLTGEWHAYQISAEKSEARTVHLQEKKDWDSIVESIRSQSGKSS